MAYMRRRKRKYQMRGKDACAALRVVHVWLGGNLLCGINCARLRGGVVAATGVVAYRHGRHASAQVGPRGEEEGHVNDAERFPDMLNHIVLECLKTNYTFDEEAGPIDERVV